MTKQIFAYYKGMLSPLLADIPSNAVLFGVYEFVLRSICLNHADQKPHLLECCCLYYFKGLLQEALLVLDMQWQYVQQR